MHTFPNSDDGLPLSKFESMLKTNDIYFFDSTEFEEIILHYMNVGKMSLAKKALELGLKQHPASITLKLVEVEVLLYNDKLDEAESLLAELEELEPLNDQVFLNKATLFSKKNQHKEAINALNIALLYTDDEVDVRSLIGMEYLYLEDYETARLNFAKCLEVEFEDYSSLYNVIYCYDMAGKHIEAIEYLVEYIDKNPYSEIAWHQLGRQYFTNENYIEALKAFDFAIVIDEYFIGAYLEKAKALEELGRYEDAIANYLITLDLDEGTSFSYLRIGKCYERLGNHKEALKYFNQTIKEDPLLDKGWLALTDLYLRNKDFQKALYFINKALHIDDKNAVYWSKYAQININLNLFEEGVRGFRKCIELEEYTLENFVALIDVLHFLGEYDDAIVVAYDAKKLYENFAEIEFRISGLYFLLNKSKQGLDTFKKALTIDFDYHIAIKDLFPAMFKRDKIKALLQSE